MCSAEEKLRAARATFGASSCHLLRVHGGADSAGRDVPWADLIGAPLPGGGAGEAPDKPPVPTEARPCVPRVHMRRGQAQQTRRPQQASAPG